MTYFGNLYVSNKMTGIPYFNAPWFDLVSEQLKRIIGVSEVFNPAEEDRKMGLDPMKCPTGSQAEAVAADGASLRKVLGADLAWIAKKADGLVVGPAWDTSRGAIAEIALAQALFIPVWESKVFFHAIQRDDTDALFKNQLPQFKELIGVTEYART